MKIIFFDVDGVLNHSKTDGWKTTKDLFVLDKECVEQLHRILLATNARIVLSSTWRLSVEGCNVLSKELEINGFTFLGKTAKLHMGSYNRSEDILDWLNTTWPYSFGWNGEKITHMAVIDDDTDADLGDGSFFKTDFEAGGLTKEIADRIITHLGG